MLFILAEKPQAAEKLASPFPFKRRKGYFEVESCSTFPRGAYIGYCVGHLLEFYKPGDYKEDWKQWSLDSLPIAPEIFKKRPSPGKSTLLKTIDTLIKKPEIKEVCIATDPAREGSNIGWEVLLYLNVKKPVKRLWISSLTEAAIKKGFSQLGDGKKDIFLHYEAHARAVSDWLIGMNMSRALTLLLQKEGFKETYPVGRVMTPVLKIIVDRDRKIKEFVPTDYWEILAQFESSGKKYEGKWFNNYTDRFLYKADGEKMIGVLEGQSGEVVGLINEREAIKPPQLFSLSSLQTEANKKYSYPPGKTLEIAQKLYVSEYISYPRSDSKYLTPEEAGQFSNIFQKLKHLHEFQSFFPLPRNEIIDDKRYVNEKLVTDHHAIIITENIPSLSSLSVEEQNIYIMIAKSVIAAHYDDALIDRTKIITEINHEKFQTSGKQEAKQGWRKVLFPKTDNKEGKKNGGDNTFLPLLEEGQFIHVKELKLVNKKTKPLKKFSEGNLVNVLKHVGRYMEGVDIEDIDKNDLDSELSKVSLGTEATRAAIIDKLKDQNLIRVEKNIVTATDKGITLVEALGTKTVLCSPELTARWEKALHDIGKGKIRYQSFIDKSVLLTESLLKDLYSISKEWDFETDLGSSNAIFDESDILGACIMCNRGHVVSEKDYYMCQFYPNRDCSFRLNHKVAGKDISAEQLQELLTKGKTREINGFISKKGKQFNAYLYWDRSEQQVKFGFLQQKTRKHWH